LTKADLLLALARGGGCSHGKERSSMAAAYNVFFEKSNGINKKFKITVFLIRFLLRSGDLNLKTVSFFRVAKSLVKEFFFQICEYSTH